MSKQNKLSAGLEHTLMRPCFIYMLGSHAIEAISVAQKPSQVISIHSMAIAILIFFSEDNDFMLTSCLCLA